MCISLRSPGASLGSVHIYSDPAEIVTLSDPAETLSGMYTRGLAQKKNGGILSIDLLNILQRYSDSYRALSRDTLFLTLLNYYAFISVTFVTLSAVPMHSH